MFLDAQRTYPVDSLPGQISRDPFDIESRKLLVGDEDVDTTYGQDCVDYANPPKRKGDRRRVDEPTATWET
jgi:hypothetical protein